MVGFGEKLKQLRLSKKLTQPELSKRIHITKSMISALETDMRSPSLDVLIRIARFFNVSTDYLLGVDKNQTIDVTGLTSDQTQVLYDLASELKKANSNSL